MKFPAEWREFLGDFTGRTRFTRHFNRPTNLEPRERVELVLDGIGGTAEIRLNQNEVGIIHPPDQMARFDITPLLLLHNVLEIAVDWNGATEGRGGLWAPVALEISIN